MPDDFGRSMNMNHSKLIGYLAFGGSVACLFFAIERFLTGHYVCAVGHLVVGVVCGIVNFNVIKED